MRIAYCTNVRLPTERAHGTQIAQVCDALVELGHEVQIYSPVRKNPIQESYHDYFKANESVKIQYLNAFDQNAWKLPLGFVGLQVHNMTMRRALKFQLQANTFDLLYTRTGALLPPLLESGTPVVIELHTLPRRNRSQFVSQCNQCKLVVCLTSPMRDELISWGVDADRVIVEGDAVDLALFSRPVDIPTFKAKRHVPIGPPIIGYAGQLSSMGLSKGVEVLLEALELLINRGVNFHALIAGGPNKKRNHFLQSLSGRLQQSVTFTGALPHDQIPAVLASSDVLVYPAPASSHPFYNRDTSPLKLFEYMAVNKPIVAADLPPLHDVVDSSHVTFATPGSEHSFADAIQWVLEHKNEAMQKADLARQKVQEHTWKKRMKRIFTVLEGRN